MTRFLFTLLSTMLISEEELRFTYAQKQGYDTSCGITVTASLLNTYWNTPVNESDLISKQVISPRRMPNLETRKPVARPVADQGAG
jgi:hypothetical protein